MTIAVSQEPCDPVPLALDATPRKQDVLARLGQLLRATADDDLNSQLAIWHSDDRDHQRTRLQDSINRKNNRSAVTSVRSFVPLSIVHYGRYRLVIVARIFLDQQTLPFVFTFLEDQGQFWASNDLKADSSLFIAIDVFGQQLLKDYLVKHSEALK